MKAEVKVVIGGKTVRLAMPIGGLELVASTEGLTEYPIELLQAIQLGTWKPSEVRAVIAAGLECGGSGVELAAVEAEMTPGEMRRVAVDLLAAALRDDSGNFGAAAFPNLAASGSRLATGS